MKFFNRLKTSKVAKAGVGYTVGNYLLKGIGFLTVPIFTRLMSTEDFGIFNVYMTYDSIITIFIALSLHSSLTNAKHRYGEEFKSYVSSILILSILNFAVWIMAVNIFDETLAELIGFNKIILNILVCHAFANSIVTVYNGVLAVDYRYKSFLKISFINTIGNIGLSLVLIISVFSNKQYMGRIVGGATPIILVALFIFIQIFRKDKPKINLSYWKYGLKYSLPVIPHGLAQNALATFDKIMIESIIGASEAGIYSLGCNVEQLIKVANISLDNVWRPWFYERMAEKDYKSIRKYSTIYAYGMFVLLACLILIAPEIIFVMGSEAYQDAKYVVIPLLACTYFSFLYTLPAAVEFFYGKTKMIAIGTVGTAVLNVILNLTFIKPFGYQAAAYTTLVSYIVYFIFHYLIAKKIEGKQLFDTYKVVTLIISVIMMSVCSMMLINQITIRFAILGLFITVNGVYCIKKVIPN